jgi:hypothetical protein
MSNTRHYHPEQREGPMQFAASVESITGSLQSEQCDGEIEIQSPQHDQASCGGDAGEVPPEERKQRCRQANQQHVYRPR